MAFIESFLVAIAVEVETLQWGHRGTDDFHVLGPGLLYLTKQLGMVFKESFLVAIVLEVEALQ